MRRFASLILSVAGIGADAAAQAPDPARPRLFDSIASVFQHPRCANCHASGPFPLQKDSGMRHGQFVVRGEEGTGAPALHCQGCHQPTNTADGKVPGAPGWHMPPFSMSLEGLTRAQICENIKDPQKNGNRTLADLVHHIKTDALVIWAWNPGAGRSIPVLSHEELVQRMEVWAAAGGPCPKD